MQCVEHKLEFTIDSSPGGHHQINARDFFVPTQVMSEFISSKFMKKNPTALLQCRTGEVGSACCRLFTDRTKIGGSFLSRFFIN